MGGITCLFENTHTIFGGRNVYGGGGSFMGGIWRFFGGEIEVFFWLGIKF